MDSGAVKASEKSRFFNVNRRLEAWNRATGSLKPAAPQLSPQAVTPRLVQRMRSYEVLPNIKEQPRDLEKPGQDSSLRRDSVNNPPHYFPRRKSLPDFAAAGRDPWSPCSPLDRCATPNPSSECSPVIAPLPKMDVAAAEPQCNREPTAVQAQTSGLATGHADPVCQGVIQDTTKEGEAEEGGVRCPEAVARFSLRRLNGDVGGAVGIKQNQMLQKQGSIAHRRGFSVTRLENSAETRGAGKGARRGGSGGDIDSMMRGEGSYFSSERGCLVSGSGGRRCVRSPLCEIMATAPPVFVWAAKRRMEQRASQSDPLLACATSV
ncbi:hypothetical protein CLOM_g9508 [Closterium sp. NIES-68]|nr:hypothetical protein CLOM_g9508 [Closterium sp. NIES-68]GJP69544.1 hypothetical protein CLOP_g548 [Closterium sp. NIES-67]